MAEEVLRPVIPPSRTQQGMSQALLSPNQHSSLRMICLRKLPVSCQEPLRDIPLTSAIRMGAKCIKVMLGLCPMCDSAMARASSIRGAVSHPINSAARFDSAPTQITFPMRPAIFTPIPHVKGMYAMIGVARAIHADIFRVARKLGLVFALQFKRITRLRQQAVEKFNVRRMVERVKLIIEWMGQDEHTAFLHYRHTPIHIMEIAERHHLYQKRIENGIHIVRRDEGNTVHDNV